jgi:hypothetical protein
VFLVLVYLACDPGDTALNARAIEALASLGLETWVSAEAQAEEDRDVVLDAAAVVLMLVTARSAGSVTVTYEWATAIARGKPVVCVLHPQAGPHPRLAKSCRQFALPEDDAVLDAFWRDVAREVQGLAGKAPSTQNHWSPARPPTDPAPEPDSYPTLDRNLMPARAGHWLVMRHGPLVGSMYQIDRDILMVGRDPANDITIDSPVISRQHARLIRSGNRVMVEDMASTNGTYINLTLVRGVQTLRPGDALALGDAVILTYEIIH